MGLLVRAMCELTPHQEQKYQPKHEVQASEANQRKQRIAGADARAVAIDGAKQAIDEPRLAAKLSGHPTRGRCDVRKWERQHQGPEHRTRLLERAPEPEPGAD